MRLPRRAAVRRKGVERREVLATVIAAFPDSLRSLTHAQQICDQVMGAAFTALPGRSGTSWVDTERYRVPKALVATSRQPLGWNDPTTPAAPIPDDTTSRTREPDQAQQLLVQVPEPPLLLPQIRRTSPAARPDSGEHDQVELDLALDTGIAAEAPVDRFGGEQLTIEVADGPPVRERAHGLAGDQDLAAQTAAAETALQRAQAAADAYDQDTRLLLAALWRAAARPSPRCAGVGCAWPRRRRWPPTPTSCWTRPTRTAPRPRRFGGAGRPAARAGGHAADVQGREAGSRQPHPRGPGRRRW